MDLTRLDPERQQRRLKLLADLAEARAARVRRAFVRATTSAFPAAPRGARSIIALRRRRPAG
jgi:hypothetical protein